MDHLLISIIFWIFLQSQAKNSQSASRWCWNILPVVLIAGKLLSADWSTCLEISSVRIIWTADSIEYMQRNSSKKYFEERIFHLLSSTHNLWVYFLHYISAASARVWNRWIFLESFRFDDRPSTFRNASPARNFPRTRLKYLSGDLVGKLIPNTRVGTIFVTCRFDLRSHPPNLVIERRRPLGFAVNLSILPQPSSMSHNKALLFRSSIYDLFFINSAYKNN